MTQPIKSKQEQADDYCEANKSNTKGVYNYSIESVNMAFIAGWDAASKQVGNVRADKLCIGCVVYMKRSSGMNGYGNPQCISWVSHEIGELSLYGHNEHYKTYDVDKIVHYPMIESATPSLAEENRRLREAAKELLHLHSCEQEGLRSGKPTFEMWFNAVNKLSEALDGDAGNWKESGELNQI